MHSFCNNYFVLFKVIKSYYRAINKISFLLFLSGFLVGLLFYFYSEDKYEKNLFRILSNNIRDNTNAEVSADSNLILFNTLQAVNELITSSRKAFSGKDIGTFKSNILDPLTVDLMTGQGACASYSLVTARILEELNIDVRLLQMKVDGEYGGHIILEARQNNNNWAVMDPQFNLHFKKPDNTLASFNDVQSNWDYYKLQVPVDYNMRYRYEDKRYTNWNKIPILMPAAKKVLEWTIGKQAVDTFSLRSFTLRKFHIFFLVTLGVFIIIVSYLLYQLYKTRQQNKTLLPSDNFAVNGKIKVFLSETEDVQTATLNG